MKLYLSYANEDTAYGERFQKQMQPVQSSFGLQFWNRYDIIPGGHWQQEMANHLKTSQWFIAFLSADFLASQRCQAETTAALRLAEQKKLHIVSILLRPVYLDGDPLQQFPILPDPERPIANWAKKDTAWLEVQSKLLVMIQATQIM